MVKLYAILLVAAIITMIVFAMPRMFGMVPSKRRSRLFKIFRMACLGPALLIMSVPGDEGGSGGEFKKAVEPIMEEFKSTTKKLTELIDKQSAEIKELGGTKTETSKQIKSLEERLETLGNDLKEAQKRADELEVKMGRPGYGNPGGEVKSPGQQFIESEQYKEMVARKAKRSDDVVIKMERKTLVTSATGSAGDLVIPYRYPEIIAAPDRILTLRSLLNVQTTDSNAIEYIEETGFTNAAAAVKEGDSRPESALSFEKKTLPVETIGHWLPATEQIISDASQLRAYIDNRLMYGVDVAEEDEVLYGTGISPSLAGIMTNTNVQQYKWSQGPEVTDTRIDAVRRAMTKAVLAGYPVTGVVLHPSDWEKIELQKDSDKRYIWVVVTIGGEQRLWKAPVIDTIAMTEGDALVGAFGIAAWLWDRQQTQIRVSDSHSDFFIKSKIAIRAEERVCLTVFRPEAFVAIEFDHAPTGGSGSGSGS